MSAVEAVGDCYLVAYELILTKPDDSGWKLIHATIVGDGGDVRGVAYDHAWCEVDGIVAVDESNGRKLHWPASWYREYTQATDIHEYLPSEVRRLARESGHAGPWHHEEP